MLLFGCKQEILQELGRCQALSATQVNIIGNVSDDIDDLHLFVKLQAFLREIAKAHRFADDDTSFVRLHLRQQHFDEGGFSRAVVAHNTHLLEA